MKRPAARIFYFEKDKVPLLLGVIAPFLEEWRKTDNSSRIWLRVHWRLGPHLDLISDMSDAKFDAELMPLLKPRVEQWLTTNASATAIDAEQYHKLSERLALFELEKGPIEPLATNNSIVRSFHESSIDIFGVKELVEAQEIYCSVSLSNIIELARTKRNNINDFYLEALKIMALTGNMVKVHGLPRTFISYRAHAEYFFTNHDHSGRFRQQIDYVDGLLKDDVDSIIRAAHNVFEGGAAIDVAFPNLAEWYREVKALSLKVYAVAEEHADLLGQDNRLGAFADELVKELDVTLDPNKARKTSEVEAYFGDMSGLFSQVPHIAYRTMVNYFYGILPILSVSPMQKYALCHLISNGCERVFGKSWQQVVDEGRPRSDYAS